MTTTARTLPHACAPRALAEELRTLATLTPTELRQRYAEVFGEASRSGNRQWLLRRIAWRLQALAEGSAAERAIDAVRLRARDLAREADLRTRAPAAPPMAAPGAPIATGTIASPRDGRIPPPGSVIVRRFKGHDYRVTVMPVGFEFDGGHYRSLSAVAHAITGGHWNGMHFFRLGTQDGGKDGRMTRDTKESKRPIRCAIYTRKSSDEGLDQDFNSLDAQREAGEAFIASQRAEGWICLPTRYDDGGFSGGSLDRPAVKRLLEDIEAGLVDCVVVYKVDRLSRSLMDFARMMQTFERRRVSFVSVTQQFNTTHSMGRLTLNILLSFAQFEREIISERTRDKIAAARRKGLWGGGRPILGYDIERRPGGNRLAVNPDEAERVRTIFRTYLECGSLLRLVARLRELGWGTKSWTARDGRPRGGRPFDKCRLLSLLTNHAYLGKVRHKDDLHDGAHEAIVPEDLFAEVQRRLRANRSADGRGSSNSRGALLRGLVRCTACGCAMVHHHTTGRTRSGSVREYRYYVCSRAQKEGWSACPGPSVPAPELERFVVGQLREVGQDGTLVAEVVSEARRRLREQADARREAGEPERADAIEARLGEEDELSGAVEGFDALWDSMRAEERERLVRLLVGTIEYDGANERVSIAFRTDVPAPGEVAA